MIYPAEERVRGRLWETMAEQSSRKRRKEKQMGKMTRGKRE
jgi:hypothetical protein